MANISKEEYISALRKLEKSPKDRVGTLSKLGVSVVGAAGGAATAGSVAAAAGATTILGSTGLGSLLGGIFVASTPVGWVIGTAAAGAAAAYGLSKLVEGGGKNEERKQMTMKGIQEKINTYNTELKQTHTDEKIGKVAGAFALLLENNKIEQEVVKSILEGVANGTLDEEYALNMAQKILEEETLNTTTPVLEEDEMSVRSAFVLLFKYMIHIDDKVHKNEIVVYREIMKNKFACSEEFANKLLKEAPKLERHEVNQTLDKLKKIIPESKYELLVDTLIGIGYSDGIYSPDEKIFVDVIKKTFVQEKKADTSQRSNIFGKYRRDDGRIYIFSKSGLTKEGNSYATYGYEYSLKLIAEQRFRKI